MLKTDQFNKAMCDETIPLFFHFLQSLSCKSRWELEISTMRSNIYNCLDVFARGFVELH